MTQRDVRAYLLDIAQACALIVEFTNAKTLADYLADPMLRAAVERQFEIVGEALRRAIDLDPGIAAAVTESALIIAFRNRLIHGYATVADETVWGVVQGKLPNLQRETDALLKKLG